MTLTLDNSIEPEEMSGRSAFLMPAVPSIDIEASAGLSQVLAAGEVDDPQLAGLTFVRKNGAIRRRYEFYHFSR